MRGGEIKAERQDGDQRGEPFVVHGGLQDIFVAASNVTGNLPWDHAAFGARHSQSDLIQWRAGKGGKFRCASSWT